MNEVRAPRLTLYEKPDRLDPQWQWSRAIPAPGHTNVDFEGRVNFDRLRTYRLARPPAALDKSDCGALLFDVNNIRYVTATKIGEWERDTLGRFALLRDKEHERPIISRLVSLDHPMEIKTGWSSRSRPTAPRPTGIRRRASRRRSW